MNYNNILEVICSRTQARQKMHKFERPHFTHWLALVIKDITVY